MKICISAESTIDLTKELLDRFDIHTVPFSVLMGEEMRLDGEVAPEELFNYFNEKQTLPKTCAVNEFQYHEHFNNLLKDYDAIIHITLSSEISCANQNAILAAKSFENVYVIDSKSLSTGIALLAIYARELANQGVEPNEIAKKVENRVNQVQASFVLNTLDYLYKGGRCSSLVRFGANLLRIKPQIIVKDGKMSAGKKYFGKNSGVIKDYCEDTLKEFNSPDLSYGFVTYSSASSEMINAAIEAMKNAGFKEVFLTVAGATISSHCGPKCLGILYFNKESKKTSKKSKK